MKLVKKTLNIQNLTVDFAVNGREENNYDVPSIASQIAAVGKIHTPPIYEKKGDVLIVLQGNRRTLGGQELLKNPHIPADLKASLEKTECLEAQDLTPRERFELIYDHGSMKPLSRTEVVKAVLRLYKEGFTETEIIVQLYFNLAKYSGNERKLRELPSETKAREAALKKWQHGTVGNFILAFSRMGAYVLEQALLTHRAEDGLLKEGEKVEMRVTRQRVTELSQAKTDDRLEWSVETGGPKFNALIEQFKKEDAGTITTEKVVRPSAKEMRDRADAFKTPAIRKVLLIASGDQSEAVKGLAEDDDRLYAESQKRFALSKAFQNLKGPIKEFVQHYLDDSVADFELYMGSFQS